MGLSIELADRYVKTFIDFWRLRPRRFFAAVSRTPTEYLSPYQFLISTLAIGLGIYVATFSLMQAAVQEVGGHPSVASAQALAVRVLAFLAVMLVVNSLMSRAISRVWPVRGIASFSSILEMNCYMLAIALPSMVLDLLLDPIFAKLILREIVPWWSLFALGLIIGIPGLVFWSVPGLATINRVSTRRVWAGVTFWGSGLGIVLGVALRVLIVNR